MNSFDIESAKTVLPLVSCIMPTYNRRAFVSHAIRYFLRQDYVNKELIIIDDGTDNVEDLIPEYNNIRYLRLLQKISLGAKLNMACEMAKGDIIMNWDDDDWYSSYRISYQSQAMKNEQIYICGINRLLYYDLASKNSFQYIYPVDQRTWLLGSSQCYRKDFWENNRFADINVGMDGLLVWSTTDEHIYVMQDNTFAVHMIHNTNVSPKQTHTGWWHHYPLENIRDVMKEDWELYNTNGSLPLPFNVKEYSIMGTAKSTASPTLRNIYACLVHEKEDCIIDLIRNLHYHDPESAIILYNGGEDKVLFRKNFAYKKYNVFFCPEAKSVKWGYLHSFALKCMEFALSKFLFDTLTIVDSDQLCTRKGYTQFLGNYLKDKPRTGMLSIKPEKIHWDDSTNLVALQAYTEYELWKPLIETFPCGESNFVHWTFWPSTVFTTAASQDLVNIFKKNKLLQQIMSQTKIWATEEVILPTLVKLMGYDIEKNPCSYNFVKYKKIYTEKEVNVALEQEDAFWLHPVKRIFDDPIRQQIREKFNNYTFVEEKYGLKNDQPEVVFDKMELINKIKRIEGWLSDKEADLLIETILKTLKLFPSLNNIVEIGSYHGKSTVLFGEVIKSLRSESKVFAIDVHDGKLGDTEKGLLSYPPSFESFKNNIQNAGLNDVVEIIRDRSTNIKWEQPVALLFIDGLHDYINVFADFHHFNNCIKSGGFVVFHDYAYYFPGVKKLVDEIVDSNDYKKISQADSLVVLQKFL